MTAVADTSPPPDPVEDLSEVHTVHGRVAAVQPLVSGLLEVKLAGFEGYPLRGGDEFVYTMVSHEPGGLPPGFGITDFMAQGDDGPVLGAYYTVRRARPEAGEIELWVVDHDHPGSVAAWMAAARPGDPVALWGPRRGYQVPGATQYLLLVADETGLAAVAALVESLPADRRATAVLECAGTAHRPPLPTHPGLQVVWVDRDGEAPGVTNRLLAAVRAVAATNQFDAAFGAAESKQISAVRRHLRTAAGLPTASMLMTGYWRRQVP